MTNNLTDHDFETSINLIREVFTKRVSTKDNEIIHLKTDFLRRECELKDFALRVSQLESQLARADKKIVELTRVVEKLTVFRQSVIESFGDDEIKGTKLNFDEVVKNQKQQHQHIATRQQSLHNGNEYEHSTTFPSFTTTMQSEANLHFSTPPPPQQILRRSMSGSPTLKFSEIESLKQRGFDFVDSGNTSAENGAIDKNKNNDVVDQPLLSKKIIQEKKERVTKTTNEGSGETSEPVHIDGRDFFKKARSVLSYDEFNSLLKNCKSYNAKEQTRTATLEALGNLIGAQHDGLLKTFERMLLGNKN